MHDSLVMHWTDPSPPLRSLRRSRSNQTKEKIEEILSLLIELESAFPPRFWEVELDQKPMPYDRARKVPRLRKEMPARHQLG